MMKHPQIKKGVLYGTPFLLRKLQIYFEVGTKILKQY